MDRAYREDRRLADEESQGRIERSAEEKETANDRLKDLENDVICHAKPFREIGLKRGVVHKEPGKRECIFEGRLGRELCICIYSLQPVLFSLSSYMRADAT